MDCIVRGVAKSRTQLSEFHFHFTFFHRLYESEMQKRQRGYYELNRDPSSSPQKIRYVESLTPSVSECDLILKYCLYRGDQVNVKSLKVKMLVTLLSRFSHVRPCATPQMAAHQAPLSLGYAAAAAKALVVQYQPSQAICMFKTKSWQLWIYVHEAYLPAPGLRGEGREELEALG